jgi:hypothetical protein
MPEMRTGSTLRYKRDEIERLIADSERRIAQGRADLSDINVAFRSSKPATNPRACPA